MASILEERKARDKKMREFKALEDMRLKSSTDSDDTASDHLALPNGTSIADKIKPRHKKSSSSFHSEPANGSLSNISAAAVTAAHHSSASFGSAGGNRDSFLNFFFGKDTAAQSETMSRTNGVAATGNYEAVTETTGVPQPETHRTTVPTGFENSSFLNSTFDTFGSDLENALRYDQHNNDTYQQHPPLTEQELLECELIRRLIISYFQIVRESIQDQVPKAVMHLLVNFSKEATQNRLVSKLYKESLFEDLLHEDEGLAEERKKCVNMLKTYKEAAKIIGEVV